MTVLCGRGPPCSGTLGVVSFEVLGREETFFYGPGAVLNHLPRHVASQQGYLKGQSEPCLPCSKQSVKSSAV